MRVLLMHPDRDWAEERALTERYRTFRREARPQLPVGQQALVQDLALDTLLSAMAGDDEFLLEAAQCALLSGLENDIGTILYRQGILTDCLKNPAVIRKLYGLVVETIDGKRKYHIVDYGRHPDSILYNAIEAMQWYIGMLRKLRSLADMYAGVFESTGLTALFAMLQREFSDEYFSNIQDHLNKLKFRNGMLVSATLGEGNEGANYTLHQTRSDDRNLFDRLLGKVPPGHTFYIHERDEAGARALGEMRDRGINVVANALAQSTAHILSFFEILRVELAFYLTSLNLYDRLTTLGLPSCLPQPEAIGARKHRFHGLFDVCLALQMNQSVVSNAMAADGMNLVIVTGANQGGKSTFLRSIGLAQVMMQCGMFVGAEGFAAELCAGVWTHYKREEDATMRHGKLDEELARLSAIVDVIKPNALLLFNESFASTNEREGSEIARQLMTAMLEKRVKVFFVTHLHKFASGVFEQHLPDAAFLRAERRPDGTRTFRIVEGEPLETSYGQDIYREVFNTAPARLAER